jgi:hypothetical protein
MKNTETNRFLLVFVLMGVLLSPNCATLTRRSTQRIPVTSDPVGAKVSVNGIQQGMTPLELRLARKEKGPVIRIEYPGYNPVEIRAKRKMSGRATLGNFLLGAASGLPITFAWMMYYDEEQTLGKDLGIELLCTAAIGGLFMIFDYTPITPYTKGFEFSPKEVNVNLTKADGMPRVETIFLDAAELQNIKWIRIHRD